MDSAAQAIPIIRLREVLVVPLQGVITDQHAAELNEAILALIARGNVRGVVLEVSGIALLDSHLCALLGHLSQSASLMGARAVMCGLKAEVVLTLISMGLELDVLQTTLGLEEALADLGVFIVERTDIQQEQVGDEASNEPDSEQAD